MRRNQYRTAEPLPGSGRALLWPDRWLYVGPLLEHEFHATHVIQISVAIKGELLLQTRPGGRWRPYRAVVTGPDRMHRLVCPGPLALVYLDAESSVGLELRRGLDEDGVLSLALEGLDAICLDLHACWSEGWSCRRCRELVDRICGGAVAGRGRPTVGLDPRVEHVLGALEHLSGRRVSLADLAAEVSLSPSRLAHVFRAETGLPLRRYALWMRLTEAIVAMSAGATLTEAAHDAGFADSAHLTRTFRRMAGMAPSSLASAHVRIERC